MVYTKEQLMNMPIEELFLLMDKLGYEYTHDEQCNMTIEELFNLIMAHNQ